MILCFSQNKIFLDYNQNHWLYKQEDGLYYVDKDYNEDLTTISDSIKQNFNQASIFINETNPKYIIQVLLEYLTGDGDKKRFNFANKIFALIAEKIDVLEKRKQTSVISKRLNIYKEIIRSIKHKLEFDNP